MKITRLLPVLLLFGGAGGIALWIGAQEATDPPYPARAMAAAFLGVEPDDLKQEGPAHELSGIVGGRPVSSVTYHTREPVPAMGEPLVTAWAEVVLDPPLVVLARWRREESHTEIEATARIGTERLQAVGEEFLRLRFPLFGEQDQLQMAAARPNASPPSAHFVWTGSGPDDLVHTIHLTLSQIDGRPCRFGVRFRPPPPPPTTPIDISPEEAEALAREAVLERFGDKPFLVQPVATDSPLAPAGQPVYVVVVYVRPMSPEMCGIHATTGEVLELRMPPL